jgi:3-hydroxyisobutyrate dehydrogenase
MVFNKPASRCDPLIAKGAKFATPAEIAANCKTVVTMVGYPRDLSELVMSPGGLLSSMKPGSLYVDHTSSSPSLAREIFAAA